MKKGFTLIEILVAVAIVSILSAIAVNMLNSERQTRQLSIIADDIVAKLEQAKTYSQTGRNGKNYGVQFNEESYILFSGSIFDPSDSENQTFEIGDDFVIIENIANANNTIVFSKIKGQAGFSAVVKVAKKNNVSKFVSVVITEQGAISVVK